jgi:hypothetical protein
MKAIITIERRTIYSSIVEMSEEDFQKYNEQLDGTYAENKAAGRELNKLIDVKDWQHDEFESVEEFKRDV